MLVGKYRLEGQLGGGGMAEVFAGSTIGAEGFTRKVAIKRVLPGFSRDQRFADMFVAEAQISSQLVHQNIVSVTDFDRDAEGRLFLVMELVEGKDLESIAAKGMLPFDALAFVMVEVLRGLGHAHDRGVVHRDVSPHNVLVSWQGDVKVSDFGIAKARDASSVTGSVTIKGKPAYMSPEQANGEALDGRSDLFSVGVMFWEMLVGRHLFKAAELRSTLAAVLFGKVPKPRSIRPEVPRDLERVVMRLLERDLSARYSSAEMAITDLSRHVTDSGRSALVEAVSARFPAGAPTREVCAVPQPVASSPMRSGRNGAAVVGASLGTVALVLLVVWKAQGSDKSTKSRAPVDALREPRDALSDASTDALSDASTDALSDASTDALSDASTDALSASVELAKIQARVVGFSDPRFQKCRLLVRWLDRMEHCKGADTWTRQIWAQMSKNYKQALPLSVPLAAVFEENCEATMNQNLKYPPKC